MNNKLKILSMMRRLPKESVYGKVKSPIGYLTLIASRDGLNALLWDDDWLCEEFVDIISSLPRQEKHQYISLAKVQLKEYFQGARRSFNIPLVVDGTEFQKKSWKVLTKIPYGRTISYQQQAVTLGDKNKVRAVGSANGRNPISIIVPCHRVIGKNGQLHGFGGGLDAKKFLIDHEKYQLSNL